MQPLTAPTSILSRLGLHADMTGSKIYFSTAIFWRREFKKKMDGTWYFPMGKYCILASICS